MAVIKVGGDTELDIKERKDRFEDALNAAMAAKEEGYVSGGGAALIYAARMSEIDPKHSDGDFQAGWSIVMNACLDPMNVILKNAGLDSEEIQSEMLKDMQGHMDKCSYGFNADTEVFEDLIKAGVIDPVKVTRMALHEAATIAGLMLTTECVVSQTEDR